MEQGSELPGMFVGRYFCDCGCEPNTRSKIFLATVHGATPYYYYLVLPKLRRTNWLIPTTAGRHHPAKDVPGEFFPLAGPTVRDRGRIELPFGRARPLRLPRLMSLG
jgi:hypothetical protein